MADMKLTPQQQAVVDNRGGTLLVSAAAGSGKTKVLVDRVMARIQQEGQNINEFLIITFTNAAAAELRGKIASAIGKALAAQPENRHLQRQMNLMHLAQISTVHAFCGALIRQYGYLLEVPSDCAMLEDPRREEILSKLISDILEEAYETMTPGFRLLADTLGAGRSDQSLEALIRSLFEKMLSQPNPGKWLRSLTLTLPENVPLGESTFGGLLLEDARHRLLWMQQRHSWAISQMQGDEKLIPKYLPAYENQKKAIDGMLAALDGPWDQISGALSLEFPKVVVMKYPDPEKLDAIKQVRADFKALLEDLRRRFSRTEAQLIQEQNDMAPALEALCGLAEALDRRFSAEKRRKNLMDFSDQEHLAIQLLTDGAGQPSAVAKDVAQRFTEIMVDEYQDSNRIQELIYCSIVRGRDENRFLVGDVKQSIYGFRQAQPELFLEKYQAYPPAAEAETGSPRKLILSKNFRSRPEILEAVNHTFTTIMRPEIGGLSYGPDESLYPGLPEYPEDHNAHVYLDMLLFPKSAAGSGPDDLSKYQKEAAWVAQRIAGLLKAGLPVRDGDGTRPARPEDFAILFRSRDPMTIYQRALTRAGIPVSADSGGDLFSAPEVQVLMSLLRVLDNPHQDVPLLAVLCSPLYRLSNDQLAKIRACSKTTRFYDAMGECPEDFCRETLASLEALRRKAETMSADQLVWMLLEQEGLLGAYSAMEGGAQRRDNLLKIYELAQSYAGGSYLYLFELLRNLSRLEAAGQSGGAQGTGGVTLTTIHRSKGLEYPIVFLCDLSRKLNFRELMDPVLLDGDLGIGAKITDTEARIRYPGLAYEALSVKKRRAFLAEEMRILYVAMTRPKDYLFMTYGAQEGTSIGTKLRPGAGCPAEPWAVESAGSLGDWVLLSAMSRVESGALFQLWGRPQCQLKVSDTPWYVAIHTIDTVPEAQYAPEAQEKERENTAVPSPEQLSRALCWRYPHMEAARTPSKVTATELKGRFKDQEAQEEAAAPVRAPQLLRPDFMLASGALSPTEKGTAAHLFLQYADFPGLDTMDGVQAELDRMVDEEYLTEQQAEAVEPREILRLFRSPLGQSMLHGEHLIREFKFSLLTDASEFYPAIAGEQVLMQGVVDAAMVEPDGITVIDFKTDRVSEAGAMQRAEHYRPQLATYKEALERIFEKPVRKTVLYFLKPGKEIVL